MKRGDCKLVSFGWLFCRKDIYCL